MKIVIVGFGSAGYAALMAIKRQRGDHQIIVIDPKEYDLFHPCGLPFALEKSLTGDDLKQDLNLSFLGVEKKRGLVTKIIPQERKIFYRDPLSQELKDLSYQALVLTTGSQPALPPVAGLTDLYQKGIYSFTKFQDFSAIDQKILSSEEVVVIGGGAIGLETAVALKKRGKNIILLEREAQLLSGIIDQDLAQIVKKYLEEQGIIIKLGKNLQGVSLAGRKIKFDLGEECLEADLGILATGVKPNITLVEEADLEVKAGGIGVNKFLQTSDPNIYAAGDLIANWSLMDKKAFSPKLATSAYKQGTLVGFNILGGRHEYRGTCGTFVSKIGELEVAGTGYSMEMALSLGYQPVGGKIKAEILPAYFPNNEEVSIKVIADSLSGKILGGQAVGRKGTAERINLISLALETDLSLDELSKIELAYCPAVSEVYDPLLRAVDFARRKIKK